MPWRLSCATRDHRARARLEVMRRGKFNAAAEWHPKEFYCLANTSCRAMPAQFFEVRGQYLPALSHLTSVQYPTFGRFDVFTQIHRAFINVPYNCTCSRVRRAIARTN